MVILLGTLVNNVVVWAQHWLATPKLRGYDMVRMVRDVFHISSFLVLDAADQIVQIVLNQAVPLVHT